MGCNRGSDPGSISRTVHYDPGFYHICHTGRKCLSDHYTGHLVPVGSAPLAANILLSPPDCFVVQFAGLVALADSVGYIRIVPLCGFWNGRVSIENSWCILAPNV